ncbi:DUF805 domain-containing protein [Mesorhizobium sp. ZC-5]|uniref:DUF805 domain-containing protein n=1 Tax=Mesorhizobium sp. ZC-5 TaxID=2986066 RepID=UPI0021E7BC02|nr:DUF805 domain-containing protein [Mesorhizobium sp. ZC-5]
MRGEVLHYDESQGFGFITAVDGNRYTFSREDLRREVIISKGMQVEFQPSGSQAREIFSIRAQMGSVPAAGMPVVDAPHSPMQSPRHFGRAAVSEHTGNTGLWSYFWRGLTANYVNFQGRARRKEYWGYYLFWLIACVVVIIVGLLIDDRLHNLTPNKTPVVSLVAGGLFALATFLPSLAVVIRRQHDIGLSGWFYLLILIPYIGGLIIFVFSLIPSQKHENKWGPIPAGVRA